MFFIPALGLTQNIKEVKLSKLDSVAGLIKKYLYSPQHGHEFSSIQLHKNGTYRYEYSAMTRTFFNEGQWARSKNELILEDKIDRDNLPITLTYSNEADTNTDFKIRIIKNLKDEELTDGFVYINNDSTQCLPLTGTCTGYYKNIDSIKVVFENGIDPAG